MRFLAFLCFVVALYLGTHAGETEGAILKTLNLRLSGEYADRQVYKEFIIAQVRRSLPTKSQLVYNLPVLSQTTQGVDFLYLRLTNYDGLQVTLAMDVANLYILGSAVYSQAKNESFFFNDVPQATRNKLFDGTNRNLLSYKGNYDSLGDRSKQEIGLPALSAAIGKLFTYTREPDRSAFLVVIQMMSESARFIYIERAISERPGTAPTNFIPNAKILSLQNNWSKLSKQIQLAQNNNGKFPSNVEIANEAGTGVITVSNVDSPVVKEDIAILLNSGTSSADAITPSMDIGVMIETGEHGGADDEAAVASS